jgi:DNA invertase Pin-like site-specific DNA recombinase
MMQPCAIIVLRERSSISTSWRRHSNVLIGYARVSTTEQHLDLQTDALTRAGCELLFTDTLSGAKTARAGLAQALSHLRRDDTLVVWKLDRLGRTTKGLIDLVEQLKERGIGLKSLQDQIDTTTPMGQFFFVVFSAIAELERSMIRERSKAGLAAARARGRKGGRPFALTGEDRVDAMKLIEAGRDTQYVMEKFGVSRSTVDRNWQRWKAEKRA